MGYQFLHVESYSRVGARTKDGGTKRTIREILDEATRVPGNIPHIENPQNPTLIFGCAPSEVEQLAENWAAESKDPMGRKIRSDGLILLAGVASMPRDHEKNFDEFAKATVEYLQEKYGDCLKSVVTHNDEAHPHLHFYVLPSVGEKFEDVHQGLKATKNAKAEGKSNAEQQLAYKQSMREFQDEFSKKVATRFGLTRIGPGRRRLSRNDWRAEQKQAEFFANAKAVAKKGYDAAYKKGQKKAAEQDHKLGEKVGSVLAGAFSAFHKPTLRVEARIKDLETKTQTQIDKLKTDAEKQAKKNEQQKQIFEVKARTEWSALNQKLAAKTQEVQALETDLKQAEAATAKAYEIAEYYQQKLNEQNTDLTRKSKAVWQGGAKI